MMFLDHLIITIFLEIMFWKKMRKYKKWWIMWQS